MDSKSIAERRVGSSPTGGTKNCRTSTRQCCVHEIQLRVRARAYLAAGATVAQTANRLGLPPSTVHRWRASRLFSDDHPPITCPICQPSVDNAARLSNYAYLLGQYLGDGHLVVRARVPVLRISACTDYPAILRETSTAIEAVRGRPPGEVRFPRARMINLQSYWTHWGCLLPQQGDGRKHERPIRLRTWQLTIVRSEPWKLLRGLIHSDGCRSLNTVRRNGKAYAYQRYTFSNESTDIITIFTDALDQVGVRWKMCRPNLVSVARRADVASMDEHIGAKS